MVGVWRGDIVSVRRRDGFGEKTPFVPRVDADEATIVGVGVEMDRGDWAVAVIGLSSQKFELREEVDI